MSHFSLLVVTDTKPSESELNDILLPFQELEGNKNSKWDWFQIGGRWSGRLDPDYDPEKDPRNSKAGGELKWPTQWVNVGNQVQVKDLKPAADLGFFAYLRKGQWVEKGDMGWWGVVSNEKQPVEWAVEQARIKASLKPDEWLTVVDCHI